MTSYSEEEYREAAKIWRQENPTEEMISVGTTIVISSGKKIPLGKRMSNMRSRIDALNQQDKEFWKEYGLLKDKREKYTEEEYKEAAEIWRQQNPTEEMIPQKEVIIISSGRKIPLGRRMRNMRSGIVKLSGDDKKFWKDYGLFYKKEKKEDNLKSNSLDKYVEMFDGDLEKANRVVDCLKDLRERRKRKKKQEWNIENILKEFDVNIEILQKYLERTREKSVRKKDILTYEGQTLRQFCIDNSYNYDVIARAIKLHEFCVHDTLEQLINRSITTYNKNGQNQPATWIYEKYGNLVKHILLHLKLDASSILKDILLA